MLTNKQNKSITLFDFQYRDTFEMLQNLENQENSDNSDSNN